MTYHYQESDDGSEMYVWGRGADPATDAPDHTLTNDGRGFSIPPDVLDVIESDAREALGAGDTETAIELVAEAAFENVERYE